MLTADRHITALMHDREDGDRAVDAPVRHEQLYSVQKHTDKNLKNYLHATFFFCSQYLFYRHVS